MFNNTLEVTKLYTLVKMLRMEVTSQFLLVISSNEKTLDVSISAQV